MEKERYMVRVSDDLCLVGIFDLQENKYVVNESIILLDTAHLLCDLFNKVDKKDKRIKELESQVEKWKQENQQLEEKLKEQSKQIEILESIKRYDIGDMLVENIKLKQSQNKKAIKALADSGVGGEKENAQKILTKLMKQYGIRTGKTQL